MRGRVRDVALLFAMLAPLAARAQVQLPQLPPFPDAQPLPFPPEPAPAGEPETTDDAEIGRASCRERV